MVLGPTYGHTKRAKTIHVLVEPKNKIGHVLMEQLRNAQRSIWNEPSCAEIRELNWVTASRILVVGSTTGIAQLLVTISRVDLAIKDKQERAWTDLMRNVQTF